MKRLRLESVLEALFTPGLPSKGNAHQFPQIHAKGPSDFPYNHAAPTMGEKKIADELQLDAPQLDDLQLEFSMGGGRTMRDPANLSNHNIMSHNGSFSNGKGSKSFGNYQLNSKEDDGMDPSMNDVEVRAIGLNNPEENPDIPDDWKPYFETKNKAETQAKEARPKKRKDLTLWSAYKAPKEIKEDVGMREKGRAYGSPITSTSDPFASGGPKKTPGIDFYSDEEIDRELGLTEWISSSLLFNRKLHSAKADMNFFDEPRNFVMNTEEEFNKNQKKRGKNAKQKKRR